MGEPSRVEAERTPERVRVSVPCLPQSSCNGVESEAGGGRKEVIVVDPLTQLASLSGSGGDDENLAWRRFASPKMRPDQS